MNPLKLPTFADHLFLFLRMSNPATRGYLYAFGAALALSGSFIFSKSVLNTVSMIQFGFAWFSIGVIWNSVWFILNKDYRGLRDDFTRKLLVALGVAILEGAATGLFYIAIQAMENPAIVSFIGNIGPVFVTILGFVLLKERFKPAQVAGIIITIAGVFVINYRSGGFSGFMEPGSLYVISAAFLFAIATIVGRKFHGYMVPGFMSLIRSTLMSIAFIVLFIESEAGFPQGIAIWRDMAVGSLLETLLTIVFAYQALKMIEATRTSLIISSKSVWTLLLAWVFLHVFPGVYQLLGGGMTLIGVWLITWDRSLFRQE